MKRVLMVTYHYAPTFSGATIQAFSLANKLRDRGMHVDFIASNSENSLLWTKEERNGFVVHIFKRKPIFFILLFCLFLSFRYKKYDFIHFHGFFPGHFLCVLFAKFALQLNIVQKMTKGDSIKCELPIHGCLKDLRSRSLDCIDKFIAISSDIHKSLLVHGIPKEKIFAIPNGVNMATFSHSISDNFALAGLNDPCHTIVCSCSVDKRKNVDILIKAFHLLIDKYSMTYDDLRFVIAGPIIDNNYYSSILEFVNFHDLSPFISFLGLIDQKDLVSIYAKATLFVFAGANEGLPNAVIEAKAAGLPVVSFDAYGVRDVVQNGIDGYIVPFGDIVMFCDKVYEILIDNKLRFKMSSASVLDANDRYSLDFIADRYIDDIYV